MNNLYHEMLPKNYFSNLFPKLLNKLLRGENVCISAIYGFGNKTVFNFLKYQIEKSKSFHRVIVYDPEIEDENIVSVVKKIKTKGNVLVIIRFLEKIPDTPVALEKLDSVKRTSPTPLSFLAIVNEVALVDSRQITALSTVFFSEVTSLKPFNKTETNLMIKTLKDYFGWKIDIGFENKIFELSGGIPRIIKYICKEIAEEATLVTNTERLLGNIQIAFQLDLLTKLILTQPLAKLLDLGIIDNNKRIKSKLLYLYLRNFKSSVISELYPNLTDTEKRLLSYLLETENKTVNLDKIGDIMKMTDEDYSLWAIYKLISRLKPKIKNNFEIVNQKGQGYYLKKI